MTPQADDGTGAADVVSRQAYELLVDTADTYREALVVRLCGEVGLRPAEIARLTPECVMQVRDDPARYLLAVPESGDSDGNGRPDDAGDRPDLGMEASAVAVERRAYLPTDLERELHRYVRSNGIDRDELIFPVTSRRLQMLVSDVSDRASEVVDDSSFGSISTGDLRRYFVYTAMVEYDVNPRVVKTVGGWRSFEALESYLTAPGVDEIVRAFDPVERRSNGDDRLSGVTDVAVLRSLLEGTDRCAVYRLDDDGTVVRWTRSAASMFGYDAAEIVGTHVSRFFTDEAVAREEPERTLAAAIDGRGITFGGCRCRKDGTRFRAFEIVSPLAGDLEHRVGFTVLVCDVSSDVEPHEAGRTRDSGLGRPYAVADRHRAVIDAVLDSTSHEQVETGTCAALVDGDSYDLAVINRTTLADQSRNLRTVNGVEPALADRLESVASRTVASPRSGDGPGTDGPTAMEDGTTPVSVVRDVSVESDHERFDGDVASVPITYGDTVYGTLLVGTTRSGAFDRREQGWLETMARQLGYAISAIHRRTLIQSDSLLELEFVCRDDRSFFVDVSARIQCRFELISLVQRSESARLFYVHLEGAPPGDVFDLAAERDDVEDCRLIETRPDGWRVEFVMSGSSPALTLTEYGVTISSTVVDEGVSAITAECPADADLRTIVAGVQSTFPDTDLRGKRTVERSVQTAYEYRRGIEDRLTERQEAALRAAYFGGYYDWPRESTAEEIADAMEISSPTLHNHLRKGQHELLRTFFDEEGVDD